jgi:hypothetical protein
MMMYKRRSVKRKNAINVYIIIGVMKYTEVQRSPNKCKESYERSKGSVIYGAVSKISYERGQKCCLQNV